MKFDLRDLELFVAVADAGSIARAAERSHTVASAVSKRISDLEEVFGCALIVRARQRRRADRRRSRAAGTSTRPAASGGAAR